MEAKVFNGSVSRQCLQGDQIASLYDLLTFKDKPTSHSNVPDQKPRPIPVETASWGRARGLKTRPVMA